MTAAQLIKCADDALAVSCYTPAGNPNRAYQQQLVNAIQHVNKCIYAPGSWSTGNWW
jgi:hypothetical protein